MGDTLEIVCLCVLTFYVEMEVKLRAEALVQSLLCGGLNCWPVSTTPSPSSGASLSLRAAQPVAFFSHCFFLVPIIVRIEFLEKRSPMFDAVRVGTCVDVDWGWKISSDQIPGLIRDFG